MRKLLVGEIFQNRYKIISELGAGGMGTVYKAEQTDAGRFVALKLLRSEELSEEGQERFYREFKLLSKLSHPNIMTIYGLALDGDNVPYAVCEFIEGESLRSVLIRENSLAWQRVARIVIQIANAMEYAHSELVVHRDLKPDNVMILQKPEPDTIKLVDFGLSKAMFDTDDLQKLTLTGQLIGSANYMSPELTKSKANERSDIYALACIAYELMSGQFLFDADAAIGVLFKHASEDPSPRMTLIRNRVPAGVIAVLLKMLQKNPIDRMASMEEVANAWQALLDDPSAHVFEKDKLDARPALGLYLTAVLVVVALASVAAFFWFRKTESVKLTNVSNQQSHLPSVLPRQYVAMAKLLSQEDDLTLRIELAKKWVDQYDKDPLCMPSDKIQMLQLIADAYSKRKMFPDSRQWWQRVVVALTNLKSSNQDNVLKYRVLRDRVNSAVESEDWQIVREYGQAIFDYCLKFQDAIVFKDGVLGVSLAMLQVGDYDYVREHLRVFSSKYAELINVDQVVLGFFNLAKGDAELCCKNTSGALKYYLANIQQFDPASQLRSSEGKSVSKISGLLGFKHFHREQELSLRGAAISRIRYLDYKLAQKCFDSQMSSGLEIQDNLIKSFHNLDQNIGKSRITKYDSLLFYSQMAIELNNKVLAVRCADEALRSCELWKHGESDYAKSKSACLVGLAVSAMYAGDLKQALKYRAQFYELNETTDSSVKKWYIDYQIRMNLSLAKYALLAGQNDFAKECLVELAKYGDIRKKNISGFDVFVAVELAELYHKVSLIDPSAGYSKMEEICLKVAGNCFSNLIQIDGVGRDDNYNCAREYMRVLMVCGKEDLALGLLDAPAVVNERTGAAKAALQAELGKYFLSQGQIQRAREFLKESDKKIGLCRENYDKRALRVPQFLLVKLMLAACEKS